MRRDNTKEKGDDMSGLKKLIAAAGAGAAFTSDASTASRVTSYAVPFTVTLYFFIF